MYVPISRAAVEILPLKLSAVSSSDVEGGINVRISLTMKDGEGRKRERKHPGMTGPDLDLLLLVPGAKKTKAGPCQKVELALQKAL